MIQRQGVALQIIGIQVHNLDGRFGGGVVSLALGQRHGAVIRHASQRDVHQLAVHIGHLDGRGIHIGDQLDNLSRSGHFIILGTGSSVCACADHVCQLLVLDLIGARVGHSAHEEGCVIGAVGIEVVEGFHAEVVLLQIIYAFKHRISFRRCNTDQGEGQQQSQQQGNAFSHRVHHEIRTPFSLGCSFASGL